MTRDSPWSLRKCCAYCQVLLDPDYYALFIGNVDNTRARQDAETHAAMAATLRGKYSAGSDAMARVFAALDPQGSGRVPKKDFLAGCAALGCSFSEKELAYVLGIVDVDANDNVRYADFARIFETSA